MNSSPLIATAPGTRDPSLPAAVALAIALAGLALPLHLPIDVDRTLPLLFLPALCLSWRIPAPALTRWENICLAWACAAMLVSAACAQNYAAAAVLSAAAGITIGGAAAARRIAVSHTAVLVVLAGILAGSLVGFATVLAGWGSERMYFPTYWSARLFGAHAFAGALAGLALLVMPGLGRWSRVAIALGTLGAWTALAWSGSRAPALGMAVALAVWFWRGDRHVRRVLLIAVPALGLLALACSRPLGTPYPQLGWWPALTRTVEARSAQAVTSDRTAYWAATWSAIRASPLIGNGGDAYLFITPKQPGNQPHNTYLQWLLEYGALGAPALLLLLTRCFRPLVRPASAIAAGDNNDADGVARWAAASVAGAAVYAIFDGVAYHMVVFMPVAVIAGLAWRRPNETSPLITTPPLAVRLVTIFALCLLLVHAWLGLLLLRGREVAPDSPSARVLRIFPSTTHGLSNWINRWLKEDPATGIAWLEWAATVSNKPANFHLQAAQLHLWAKNWPAAERELAASLDKVALVERADVQRLLDEIRAIIAKSGSASSVIEGQAETPAP